jgi:hypothetical protein
MRRPQWACELVCLALALLPTAAFAEGPRFEITPFVGARFGGGFDVDNPDDTTTSADLGSGVGYGLGLGLYRDRYGFYELLYATQDTSLDSTDPVIDNLDIRIDYLQIGGTALFDEDERFIPFVSLTVGAARLEPDRSGYDSETKFAATFGTGLRIPISERIVATLGLRGYATFLKSNTSLFCASTPTNAGCLVKSTGSVMIQGEGSLGLTVRF